MHYLIYKTTCLVNGKYYVGKHKTKNRDDTYLGSGKLLRAAIKKYGRENFVRETLLECITEEEMVLAEKILVVPDREVNYNLCPGGQGGWGYVNRIIDVYYKRKAGVAGAKASNKPGKKNSGKGGRACQALHKSRILKTSLNWNGRHHSEETKRKMSNSLKDKQKGSKNSQFGTCWMTNGAKNVKIKRDDVDRWIEMGYKLGRN